MAPRRVLLSLVLVALAVVPLSAQELRLPPRPADAPAGSEIVRDIRPMDLSRREERIYDEIARGNVPSWLRRLRPVRMTREGREGTHVVVIHVTPDYLAVGSDDDYFRVPLTPGTAQRVADLTGTSLPTSAMVDAIWREAEVRLGPDSIPPGPAMTTVPVFERHEWMVEARRAVHEDPPGALVAGHHKDVVLSARLDTLPGRVAIYGWHRPDGRPIQPLYTGHASDWADYSHGVRLVWRTVSVDGALVDLVEVLADSALAGLLSDEGAIRRPRYGQKSLPVATRSSSERFPRFGCLCVILDRGTLRPRGQRRESRGAWRTTTGGDREVGAAASGDLRLRARGSLPESRRRAPGLVLPRGQPQ